MCKQLATVTTSAEGSLCATHQAKLTGSNDESEHDNKSDNAEVGMGGGDDVGMGDAMTEGEGVGDSTNV
jgi:hypothetical protein